MRLVDRVARPRPTLLVLRALGLGDLLAAMPSLRALADAFPDHQRLLATPSALAPLAELSGAVDGIIDARPLTPLPAELARADVAVNLHGRGPQSHRVLLDLHPVRLLAFANHDVPETEGLPAWRSDEHEVDRWCRLLAESGVPADPRRLDLPAPEVDPPEAARGATIVHPGAASVARRWPIERWAAVARAEVLEGRQVVVTGAPGEEHLAAAVADMAGLAEEAVLAGHLDVVNLASVVAAAGLVLCGDTGVAHLATAFATPSVVLFGPTPPHLWGPPPDRPHHRALWKGSTGDPHADRPDPGLLAITVDDVLEAVGDVRRTARASEMAMATERSGGDWR
jgi:ADP-heptose:LPS heptosyltransferase